MAIDTSLFSQTVSIPSANSMLNAAPAASLYNSVHSALGNLPDAATLSQVQLPSSFTVGAGTGSGTGSGTVTPPVSPYASDVTDADVTQLTASITSLQGIHSSGDLANLSSITTSMTSQVVGQTPSIPSGWLKSAGTTSSLTSSLGTPNALSLLSSQQSAQSLANQMQGNTSANSPQTCGIAADITGAIHSMQSGLSQLYQDASSEFKSIEGSIASTVSSCTSTISSMISGGGSGSGSGGTGSGGSGGLITKAQIQSLFASVSAAVTTVTSEVSSAISNVVKTVDSQAVAIENQIKLGVANALNGIKSDPCFSALGSLMAGSSVSSILSKQTGIDTTAANKAQAAKNCSSLLNDYPQATAQNLSDIASQLSAAQADQAAILTVLNNAVDALNAQIESSSYQTVKNNQNASPAAMAAYQQAKAQMQASPPFVTWQTLSTVYGQQGQAVSALKSFSFFMKNTGQLPSNPNGPWYTAANLAKNIAGTATGKLP